MDNFKFLLIEIVRRYVWALFRIEREWIDALNPKSTDSRKSLDF